MSVKSNNRITLLSRLEQATQTAIKLEIEEIVAEARNRGEAWVGSWTAASVRSELDLGSTLLALGQNDQHLEAFLCFRPPGPFWEILLVVTLGHSRGQRLAGALIDALFDHIEEVGQVDGTPHDVDSAIFEVGLEVRADNFSALRCYKSCGFIEQGRRKGYYPSAGTGSTDAILMSLKRRRRTGPTVKAPGKQ